MKKLLYILRKFIAWKRVASFHMALSALIITCHLLYFDFTTNELIISSIAPIIFSLIIITLNVRDLWRIIKYPPKRIE